MLRVLGIDPGSGSYDLCGLQDGKVFLDESIPTARVAEDPDALLRSIEAIGRLDAAVVPSGYGLPLTRLEELTAHDMAYLSLTKSKDRVTVPELRVSYQRILGGIKSMGLNAYLLPGVVQLDTVPEHRKANRIDMGTPDKLCTAALALWDQSVRLDVEPQETSFILLELGFAYTAALAVQNGCIVDGIGGTSGSPGFLSMGAWDGELAYYMGDFGKDLLFEGGIVSVAGRTDLKPHELVSETVHDRRLQVALECYLEGLKKSVLALSASVEKPREILLAGRSSRVKPLTDLLRKRLESLGQVRVVDGIAERCKESAQGAAMLADGIAGGAYSSLVELMRIRHASGTVLDHIYLPKIKERLELFEATTIR